MIEPKSILKKFSDQPITYKNLQKDGFDIGNGDFVNSFLWLKSEGLIKPLDGYSFGISVGACGTPSWSVTDLIITSNGKNYLNPPIKEKEPISLWLGRPVAIALVSTLVTAPISGAIGYYFGQLKKADSTSIKSTPSESEVKKNQESQSVSKEPESSLNKPIQPTTKTSSS